MGPYSPVWAAVPSVAGLVLAVPAAVQAFGMAADERTPGYLVGLLLALALMAGGFSLARLLQLALMASRWDVQRQKGLPSRRLMGAHSMHATWVSGVAGSLVLMGVLGWWSVLDGRLSGLESGTALFLTGILVLLASVGLNRWTEGSWERHTAEHEQRLKDEREEWLNDPLGRIREASRRSHPESDPSS